MCKPIIQFPPGREVLPNFVRTRQTTHQERTERQQNGHQATQWPESSYFPNRSKSANVRTKHRAFREMTSKVRQRQQAAPQCSDRPVSTQASTQANRRQCGQVLPYQKYQRSTKDQPTRKRQTRPLLCKNQRQFRTNKHTQKSHPGRHPISPQPCKQIGRRVAGGVFFLSSIVELVRQSGTRTVQFTQVKTTLVLVTMKALMFNTYILLAKVPLTILITTFTVYSFVKDRLFNNTVLIVRRSQQGATSTAKQAMVGASDTRIQHGSIPSERLSGFILRQSANTASPTQPFGRRYSYNH